MSKEAPVGSPASTCSSGRDYHPGIPWVPASSQASISRSAREGGENPPRTRRRNGQARQQPAGGHIEPHATATILAAGRRLDEPEAGRPARIPPHVVPRAALAGANPANGVPMADPIPLTIRPTRAPGRHLALGLSLATGLICASALHADDPFAVEVVLFNPGSGGVPGFDDPAAALGPPTRTTGGLYCAEVQETARACMVPRCDSQ